jgi:hypothetical protein
MNVEDSGHKMVRLCEGGDMPARLSM